MCHGCACAVHVRAPTPLRLHEPVEVAWNGAVIHASRLRLCSRASSRDVALAKGLCAVTGGLGGLGLRAAVQLAGGGSAGVVLSSRSGRVVRDGQGLDAQLASLRGMARVLASDVGDAADALMMLTHSVVSSVLHAAGVLKDKILCAMSVECVQTVYAPKALAASHVHRASAQHQMEAMGLFSSVASTLGNVGQANYAAANAHLDAMAVSRRRLGTASSSLQIPAVHGAGMGAATFDAAQLDAMGGISLDEFAVLLEQLAPEKLANPLNNHCGATKIVMPDLEDVSLSVQQSVCQSVS